MIANQEGKGIRKIVLVSFILVVLMSSIGSDKGSISNEMELKTSMIPAEIYLPHDPINITSNDDFVSEGWAGKGTLNNPYSIESFVFSNTTKTDEPSISISNTTAYFKIYNCLFNATDLSIPIALNNVTNGLIQHCTVGDHTWYIYGNNCSLIQFKDLALYVPIIMDNSNFCSFSRCFTYGAAGYGIDLTKCNNMTIEGCDILNCAASSIHLEDTNDSVIIGNKLEASDYGVFISGISTNNLIYNNVMNPFDVYMGVGRDDGLVNYWDDGVSTGNWWLDYGGSGVYEIYGSAGAVDHYPMGHSSVLLVSPMDVSCQILANVSIIWDAFSEVPDHFIIFRNGEVNESGVWDGNDLSTNMIAKTEGIVNYTVFVNGTSGDSKVDTVIVTILDDPPTINSPSDISYIFGESDKFINWIPLDTNPDQYEIYQNGSLILTDDWDGSPISYSVSGLSVGIYEFELCVFDTSGNSANDTVQVTVTPEFTTTSTTTVNGTGGYLDDLVITSISIASAGIILIVVILILKKRKG